jgi:hypothetical protein
MIAKLGRSFANPRRLGLLSLRVTIFLFLNLTQGHALDTESERTACAPDVFRLCSSEIPDVDRIIACMKAKRASLSAPCRVVFDTKLPEDTAQNAHRTP